MRLLCAYSSVLDLGNFEPLDSPGSDIVKDPGSSRWALAASLGSGSKGSIVATGLESGAGQSKGLHSLEGRGRSGEQRKDGNGLHGYSFGKQK